MDELARILHQNTKYMGKIEFSNQYSISIISPEFSKDTIVTWRFESLDKNKTKVVLSHSGFTENDRQQYDEHSEGWTWFVTRLDNYLTKGEP